MPTEVKSATEATRIATSFLKQYYSFLRPISAKKDNDHWIVQVDVGIVVSQIADVEIDASTADITGYSFPE